MFEKRFVFKKRAFTLVELLMVLGLMAVLIIFVIPSVISFVNKRMTDVEEVENKLLLESISSYMERNPNQYTKRDGEIYCIPVSDMIEFGSLEKVFVEKSEKYSENQTMLVSISYGAVTILEIFDGECVLPLYYGPVTWTSQVGTVTAEIPAANGTTVEYRVGQGDTWGSWQASRTFAGLNPVEEYEFQANIDTVTIEDTIKSMSPKANQEMGAITDVSWTSEETSATATITAVIGATHYRVNSGSWQESNIFPSLVHLTEYTFRARKAATATLNEAISSGFVSTSPDSTPAEIEYVNNPTEPSYPANATPCGDVGNEFTHVIDKRATDPLEHKTYAVTKIGTQCWFAENLAYTTPECLAATWDTNAPHDACRTHGADEGTFQGTYMSGIVVETLYQWDIAMNYSTIEGAQGICPEGWHIPSSGEWLELFNAIGSSTAATQLKDNVNWNGTNTVGFSALPSGQRSSNSEVQYVGQVFGAWSSTPATEITKRKYSMNDTDPDVSLYNTQLVIGGSIRCLFNQ